MTEAFEETRIALRKAAERNKRYYDVRVRPKKYRIGDWVYCFNPRKAAKPFTVHIDKLKPYLGETPKSWLTEGPKDRRKRPSKEQTKRNKPKDRLTPKEVLRQWTRKNRLPKK